jgi:ribosomal protein L7/L12
MDEINVVGLVIAFIFALLFLIDRFNRAKKRRLQESGMLPPDGQGTDADVERLLLRGEKLSAIKLYRDIHGVGLKEAKEAVEEISKRVPSAQ